MIAETRSVALFSIVKIQQGGPVLFYQKHGVCALYLRPELCQNPPNDLRESVAEFNLWLTNGDR
jgi:hypothetical protein